MALILIGERQYIMVTMVGEKMYQVKRKGFKTNTGRFKVGDLVTAEDLENVKERVIENMLDMGWIAPYTEAVTESADESKPAKRGRPRKEGA